MLPKLETIRIELNDCILNITSENVNGVMTTGYLEFVEKNSLKAQLYSSYAILGQEVLGKNQDCDKYRLDLVLANKPSLITYQMELFLYDDYAEVAWIDSGQIEPLERGNYLPEISKSDYKLYKENYLSDKPSCELEQLSFKVEREIYKEGSEYNRYYSGSSNLDKIIFNCSDLDNRLKSYDVNGKLILDIPVRSFRLNNKWMQYGPAFTEDKVNSFGFMNQIVESDGKYKASIIMTYKGRAHFYFCELCDIRETDLEILKCIPKL